MRRLVAPLLFMLFGILPAAGQEIGSVQGGRILAEEVCAACHVVGSEARSGRTVTRAPDFISVANMPAMNAVSLSAFLITPHPTMPNLMLSQEEAADIVAYIMSLRRAR